jgi:hypothetical protein
MAGTSPAMTNSEVLPDPYGEERGNAARLEPSFKEQSTGIRPFYLIFSAAFVALIVLLKAVLV